MTDRLRLFIWEGNGISSAYHDDGTLVVLAHDPEEARLVVRRGQSEREKKKAAWMVKRDKAFSKFEGTLLDFWKTTEGIAVMKSMPTFYASEYFDGTDTALDRKPRIVELDEPKWVVFNGGGYD